jgi:catechol 2,3-dioxygenase-like lactoylglutathione lyase family enzyme
MTLTADPATYDWSRQIFDHVTLRVADVAASRAFYAAVCEPLGVPLLTDTARLVQFGSLLLTSDDGPVSSRVHLAFAAASQDAVDAFHAAGLAAGATDNGAPGPRTYGAYAAFLLDPDGNNIEAASRVLG